jgi:autophagy-related protein 18
METKIHIYDISTMKTLHTIDTFPNPKGVCAFSPCHKKCYLAYPAAQNTGDVYLFDALSLQAVSSVSAHKASIAAMAMSHDGLLLATASEKGTVIRVHTLPNFAKSESFRRGSYPAGITSLCFSLDGKYLAAVELYSNLGYQAGLRRWTPKAPPCQGEEWSRCRRCSRWRCN